MPSSWSKEALITLIGLLFTFFCTTTGLLWRAIRKETNHSPKCQDFELGFSEVIAPNTHYREGPSGGSAPILGSFDEVVGPVILESRGLQEIRKMQQQRYSELLELRRGTF